MKNSGEEQNKPRVTQRKVIIMIRAEISELKTKLQRKSISQKFLKISKIKKL